jgi:hypothetical protein
MSLSAAIGNASPHRANDRGAIAGSCKQVTELTVPGLRTDFLLRPVEANGAIKMP